jgi:hypothetical protein
LVIPVVLVLLTAATAGVLRAATGHVPLRELLAAAGIIILSSETAVVPTILTRGAGQIAVSQAALVGTIVHLFFSISLAAVLYMMRLVGDRQTFLFLLLAFYWISLVMLVVVLVRAVRRAPTPQPGPQ